MDPQVEVNLRSLASPVHRKGAGAGRGAFSPTSTRKRAWLCGRSSLQAGSVPVSPCWGYAGIVRHPSAA